MRTSPIAIDRVIGPRSIALIGASEDYAKFGGRIMHHLVRHDFPGRIFPINPKRETVLGIPCFASVEDLPEQVDAAVLALPVQHLETAVEACGRAGVGACIVITAQLGEFSDEGAALEARIVEIASGYNMRLVGPNCMGLIVPAADLALSSSPTLNYAEILPKGPVAFVSQSGAMMGTLFLHAYDHGVDLSGMVSVGNQADLELCDFLEGFIDDADTGVICLYVEGLKSPPRFRALCLKARDAGKRILAVKAGRTEAGSTLARSHTASLAGSYSAFEALCRETGVLMMDDPDSMILCAGLLAANPKPGGKAAGIVCASGGGGAVLADQLAVRGLEVTDFAPDTRESLSVDYLPTHQNNPLDLGGHVGGLTFEIFQRAIDAIYNDPGVDVFVYVLTPQPLMAQTIEHLIKLWKRAEKPVILVLNLSNFAGELRGRVRGAGIPFITRNDDLLRALDLITADVQADAQLRQTEIARPPDLASPEIRISGFLTEPAAKGILRDYGMLVPDAHSTDSPEAAVAAAEAIGYPVVLKGVVTDVVHKSDLGLVRVGLSDEASLRSAWEEIAAVIGAMAPGAARRIDVQRMIGPGVELFVGLTREPGFGPQLLLGAGGVHVELFRDTRQMRAPVDPGDVKAMLRRLRLWPLLAGARGQPILPLDEACQAIASLSWLALDLGERLVDFEINPFRITTEGAYALDGRGTLKKAH